LQYYSKVGGVPCNEINSLEVEFLFMCNFTLFVTTDTYSQYYTELCNHAVNTTNLCVCSQGPKVPPLVIPYVNAPGPGQTIAEWNRQQSAQIPMQIGSGVGGGVDDGAEMTEEEMAHYAQAQQQQQQQHAYEQQQLQLQQQQQQQQHMQHEAAAAAASHSQQQQYGNYTPAQLAAAQQAQKQRQQQYAQQHDQSMS
jgi:hypothetical protein